MTVGEAALLGWYDIAPGAEAEHQDWYVREHIPERLSLPGFRVVRRFERGSDAPANSLPTWFTLYETDGLDALASTEYLARLDAPTALTRRLAPTALRSLRSAARLVAGVRIGAGGHAATTALHAVTEPADTAVAECVGVATAAGSLHGACVYRRADDITARKGTSTEAAVVASGHAPPWTLVTEGHEPVAAATMRLHADLETLGLYAAGAPTPYRLVYARAAERASALPAA